jgi:protein-S-isoprenylcysteine O-methyltransferase Ste14
VIAMLVGMGSFLLPLAWDLGDSRPLRVLKGTCALACVALYLGSGVALLADPWRFRPPPGLRLAAAVCAALFLLLLVQSLVVETGGLLARGPAGPRAVVTTGTYALVRHPGVLWYLFFHLLLGAATGSVFFLLAAPLWAGLNIAVAAVQDTVVFPRVFGEPYRDYQQEVPFLLPSGASVRRCLATTRLFALATTSARTARTVAAESTTEGGRMPNATDLLRQNRREEIWRRYCGFLDLSVTEFQEIQDRLLLEQLPRLAGCALGRRLFDGQAPRTVEEFRRMAPFTTYADYSTDLLERREDVLPEKPLTWAHTSGRSGEYSLKWIPYSRGMYEVGSEFAMAIFLLACCRRKGDIVLREGMRCPYTIAPPPYISGIFLESLMEQFNFSLSPPKDRVSSMGFQERIQEAFRTALDEGLDFFYGVTSILLAISENFGAVGRNRGARKAPALGPRAWLRLARAFVTSRLAGRPILPRDIWKVKGAACGGMDTAVFKDKVAESWGIVPLEAYGSTELGISATQSWTYDGLTFTPYTNYWEFITEEDYRTLMVSPGFRPPAKRMNELEAGREYVLVGTSFHGGALVRYILGDLIRIASLEDKAAGITLPQATFVSRVDDVIDVGGFTRLTEKTIWQAIESSGIPYAEWMIRKEYQGSKPVLHLYLEPRDRAVNEDTVAAEIHARLKEIDPPYKELEEMTGMKPLRVSLLSEGTFHRYFEERQAAGADLAHLKPPHVNPSDKVVELVHRMSAWKL